MIYPELNFRTEIGASEPAAAGEPSLHHRAPPSIPDHELLRCIGRGSYGEVWLARNVMAVYRAVKIVYRDTFESDRPYEREYYGIRKFEPISRRHESQVDILHVGRNDQAGCFYYVMELADDAADVTGLPSKADAGNQSLTSTSTYEPKTLRSELKRRGRLPFDECLEIALSLSTALHHLHEHGLIHRDIKPDNIIFVEGLPKLADIGLVAAAGKTMTFVGTDGYLPPEGPNSAQADIFSLGRVLYEISTGKDRLEFPEMPTFIDTLPEQARLFEFNEVLLKACEQDVTQRYQTAARMHEDLLLLKAGKSVRRAHLLERRVAMLTKFTAVGIALTALVVAGYVYQQRQTHKANRLAAELQITQGIHVMDQGDLAGSLLWFVQAMDQARWTKEEMEMHRLRLGAVLRDCPKLVQLISHERPFEQVEFSPDGQRLLTYSSTPNVQISDVATGEALVVLHHTNEVWRAAFGADGTRVVTLSSPRNDVEKEVRVWNVGTGQSIGPPIRHSARSARVITGSDEGAAPIWDVLAGLKLSPGVLNHRILRAAVSRDGRSVITAGEDGTVQIWDADSGEPNGPALQPLQNGHLLEVSPDGRSMLTISGHTVSLLDSRTGEQRSPRFEFSELGPTVSHVEFNPDAAKVLAISFISRVQVLNAATGEQVPLSLKHPSLSTDADLSSDGRFVAVSDHLGLAQICEATTGTLITSAPLQSGTVWDVRFHPDGRRFATANRERLLRVWEVPPARFVGPVYRHTKSVTWAGFSPDGQLILSASRDGTARLWHAATGKEVLPAWDHRGFRGYGRPSFRWDGKRVLTTSDEKVIQLWDADTGEPLGQAMQHQARVRHAELSPDGKLVVTAAEDGTVQLWDADTRKPAGPPIANPGQGAFASFSPDGRRLATIASATASTATWFKALVWDVSTGRPLTPPMPTDSSWGRPVVSFSSDGNRLLTQTLHQVRVWDAHSGQPITPTLTHDASVIWAACFSPDGRRVLTAGGPWEARLWDAATGEQLTRPLEHERFVSHAAFSPDGRRIVTASADHTARIWDASTGFPLTPPLHHRDEVNYAEFSPDGRRIVTACADGTARVWEFAPTDWAVDDLRLLAQLLSGRTIDGTGSFSSLKPEDLRETLRKLKTSHPEYFQHREEPLLPPR